MPFGRLIHLSIVAGVLTTLAYMGLAGPRSALLVAAVAGFAYMIGNLILLDLAARVCPVRVAGTVFAVLMALSNLGVSLSSLLGGVVFDALADARGPNVAFDCLVVIGAAFTSACWLLVPVLRRYALPAGGG